MAQLNYKGYDFELQVIRHLTKGLGLKDIKTCK